MRLAVEILSEAKDRDIGLRLEVFIQPHRVLNPHEARFAETLESYPSERRKRFHR